MDRMGGATESFATAIVIIIIIVDDIFLLFSHEKK